MTTWHVYSGWVTLYRRTQCRINRLFSHSFSLSFSHSLICTNSYTHTYINILSHRHKIQRKRTTIIICRRCDCNNCKFYVEPSHNLAFVLHSADYFKKLKTRSKIDQTKDESVSNYHFQQHYQLAQVLFFSQLNNQLEDKQASLDASHESVSSLDKKWKKRKKSKK